MARLSLAVLLVLADAAVAAPMAHQGRLLDAAGAPINGDHSLAFRLYSAPNGGAALWSETLDVVMEDGFFSVLLGESSALEPELSTDEDRWLGVSVDSGAELAGRKRLTSVPYAARAASVRWLDVEGVPPDLLDGDDVLTEAEVEAYVTNGPIDLATGSTLGGARLATVGAAQSVKGAATTSGGSITVASDGSTPATMAMPGLSVTVTPTSPSHTIYVNLTANIRLRYESGDQCELRVLANGGGHTNTVVGVGNLYNGIATDTAGHQQASVAGVLVPTNTTPVTFTATLTAIHGGGPNNTVCYLAHRSNTALVAFELAP